MRSVRPLRPCLGFTLIELLTVIAIIGILAAIIIPVVGKVRKTAKAAQCVSNLRQWSSAFQLYANDNKGNYFIQGRFPDPVNSGTLGWSSAVTQPTDWPYGAYLSASTNAYTLRFCPLYTKDYPGNPPPCYAITRPRMGTTIWSDIRAVPFPRIQSPSRFLMLVDTDPSLIGTTIWVSNLSDLNARVVPTIDVPDNDRHEGKLHALFADGHVDKVTKADITTNGDLWCRFDN